MQIVHFLSIIPLIFLNKNAGYFEWLLKVMKICCWLIVCLCVWTFFIFFSSFQHFFMPFFPNLKNKIHSKSEKKVFNLILVFRKYWRVFQRGPIGVQKSFEKGMHRLHKEGHLTPRSGISKFKKFCLIFAPHPLLILKFGKVNLFLFLVSMDSKPYASAET